MNSEKLMVFDNQYFKINKWFLNYIGLWPFSFTTLTLIKRIFIIIFLTISTLPSLAGIPKYCGVNKVLCIENITGFLFLIVVNLKYSVTLFSLNRIQKVYEYVSTNWLAIKDPKEREIIEGVAKQGKALTMAYAVYAISCSLIFTQMSMIPPLLDLIIPLNESRQKLLVTNAYYGFDPYKYFYELYFGYSAVAVIIATATIAIDTAYTVIVQQCIGTFCIVQHRVCKATNMPTEEDSIAFLISAVKLHKSALQFIVIIESAYNVCLLFLLGLTIVGLSIGTLAILETIRMPFVVLKFLSFLLAIYMHLFYITMPGQKVINASNDLFINLYNNQWYNMSEKPKTLLKIIMMRCAKPSILTAGGLYVMNVANAGLVLKTSVSYFMVAVSIT